MRILLVLAVLSTVIGVGHWFIYRAISYFWDMRGERAVRTIRIITTILGISFVAMTLIASMWSNLIISWLYTASAVWLGTALLLGLASIAGVAITLMFHLFGRGYIGRHIGKVLIVIALILSGYGVVHSYDTQVTRYTVALPGLPEAWEGKTIAFIADTHLGNVRGIAFSQKIADLVAAQNPELLLIAGDFFDGPPADYATLAQPFGDLDLPRGVLFANGNHEEFADKQEYATALESVGVTVLSNVLQLEDGLQIAGIDYFTSNTIETASTTLASLGISATMPTILIKHSPVALSASEAAGVDLQVSGHTHGGQTWPIGFITRAIYGAYMYGSNAHGSTTVITTSGAGTWGPPQRLGTNPEIVLITLERAS